VPSKTLLFLAEPDLLDAAAAAFLAAVAFYP